jgi:hypothetical protein
LDKVERNTEAAALARPLLLGDTTLLISQPTPSTMAAIAAVVRRRCRRDTPLGRVVGDPALKELSPQERMEVLREAGKVQARGDQAVDPLALMDEMLEPPSLAFAIWTLARPNHPDLRLEEITALVNEDNSASTWVAFTEASGMALLGNAPGASGSAASGT